jgi:hypothetical protein
MRGYIVKNREFRPENLWEGGPKIGLGCVQIAAF